MARSCVVQDIRLFIFFFLEDKAIYDDPPVPHLRLDGGSFAARRVCRRILDAFADSTKKIMYVRRAGKEIKWQPIDRFKLYFSKIRKYTCSIP